MNNTDVLQTAALQGQSLLSLGIDRDQLLMLVRQDANGPPAVPLFFWLCSQIEDLLAGDLAVELISVTQDPASMAEIVDRLARQDPGEAIQRRLGKVFMDRVGDKNSCYGVRAQALHGALLIAQHQKGLLHQLKGFLTDLDISNDPLFLRHAAKILGVLLAHSPELEFRNRLCELLEIPEARDEAAMELGLDALRRGIDAVEQEAAGDAFESALHWFNIALESSEDRVDAQLYTRCLSILVSVHQKGLADNSTIDIAELAKAAWNYSAYFGTRDEEQPSWLGMLSTEHLHWTFLASKLGTLNAQLQKKVWMNAARAIEDELLAVYLASRSILHKDRDTGLDLVIRPRLSASLLVQRRHLDELDQWIEENEGSPLLPDAAAMREAVEQARDACTMHYPFVEGSEGRTLQAILDAGCVPSIVRTSLSVLFKSALMDLSSNENPIIDLIVKDILTQMERNKYYSLSQAARSLFTAVLIGSAYFLSHRHDTGMASDPEGKYLFIRQHDDLPQEVTLQRDYYRMLRMSGLRDYVHMEVRDQGSGRADVYFKAQGVSTVTEVKRTLNNMDHKSLLESYGLQTTAYQTTNVTFGFLLVLDLWDRCGGQPHLSEQMSLQYRIPPGQTTAYDVVVMRVQGQRKSPSDLHESP